MLAKIVAISSTACVGALGYALTDHPAIAPVMLGMAGLAWCCRRWIVGLMDRARNAILAGDASAILRFCRLHIGGMLLNVAQLAVICVGMAKFEFI